MKKLICIIILLQTLIAFGQETKIYDYNDVDILQVDSFNLGLYFTYDEFIKNKPSKTDIYFKKDTRFAWEEAFIGKRWEDLFVYDSTETKTKVKDKLWGYCNGEKIFIYYKKRYCEVNILGRYSVFIYKMDEINLGYSSGSYVSAYDEFILDILTGEIYKLRTRTLKKYVLDDYSELLEKFKNESLRHTMYYMYIKEVNSKYN